MLSQRASARGGLLASCFSFVTCNAFGIRCAACNVGSFACNVLSAVATSDKDPGGHDRFTNLRNSRFMISRGTNRWLVPERRLQMDGKE